MFGENLLPEAGADLVTSLACRRAGAGAPTRNALARRPQVEGERGRRGGKEGERVYSPTATVINSLMLMSRLVGAEREEREGREGPSGQETEEGRAQRGAPSPPCPPATRFQS